MTTMPRTPAGANSFLPEDYLQKKAERRAIIVSLALFLVVAFGITGAGFVTFKQRSYVLKRQERVTAEFVAESKKIDQLKVLEAQREELKEKADVTLALVERVPRSVLLAELINRMPRQATLTQMKIVSKRVQATPPPPKPSSIAGPQTLAQARAAQTPKAPKPGDAPARPQPTKFEFRVELSGLSSSDDDVADFYQALVNCPLLDRVDMIYSSDTVVDETPMRKFQIEATIRAAADARQIEPLHVPRLPARPGVAAAPRNPLDPTLPRDDAPAAPTTAGVNP